MTLRTQITLYFVLLFSTWLLWSGYLKPLLVGFGVASCVLVIVLILRMKVDLPQERFWLRLLPRLPRYWLWLIGEVIVSNLWLARVILRPRLRIEPRVVDIQAEPGDAMGQAILGNCITLTPGTVTLDDHDGVLKVHCITPETAAALESGTMNRRVAELTRS